MVFTSILALGPSLNPPEPPPHPLSRPGLKRTRCISVPCCVLTERTSKFSVSQFFRSSTSRHSQLLIYDDGASSLGQSYYSLSWLNIEALICHVTRQTSRTRSKQHEDADSYQAAENTMDEHGMVAGETLGHQKNEPTGIRNSFLLILAIATGIATIITITSISLNQPSSGSFYGVQCLAEGSASSVTAAPPVGFTFKAFGYRIMLPEYAPGWIYFWLLMAAGFGLFVSEEALNIWVGISLARLLTLDGTWQSLVESFSRNAPYILSTILWVYWGVCISDMIPFYMGKLFRESGASDNVCAKLGIGEEKVSSITHVVQKYGNLSGMVERFSLGVRNPTAFLAGTLGISPECFFAGVCFGALITLPLQLGIGFLSREHPVFAIATVATGVAIWTVFPYAMAVLTALFIFLRRRYST